MLPALSSIAAGAFAGALFLVAPHGAYAQQFAGQVIANQLPNPIPGGALASFNVADAKGKGTTLMNYFSSPSGGTVQPSLIQRAIVVIHGLDRDPWLYFATVYNALPAATAINPAVNENTVAIMAPYFTNGDDKTFGYPWANSTGLTAGKGSTSNALVWSGMSSSPRSSLLVSHVTSRKSMGIGQREPVPVQANHRVLLCGS
jgi:hypothetical protein